MIKFFAGSHALIALMISKSLYAQTSMTVPFSSGYFFRATAGLLILLFISAVLYIICLSVIKRLS